VDKEVRMPRPATGRRGSVLLGAITLVAAVAATLAPAAAAAQPACRVKNPIQDTWFATQDGRALTRAIAAANPGDRLNVFGTCGGNYVIDKDLRVFGTTQATAPTTLDGRGSGRVLTVLPSLRSGVSVRLTRLVVTGGGVYNFGDLTLNWSRLTRNTSGGGGGGLFNEGTAVLNLSRVTGNTAAGPGGGILDLNTLLLNSTVVSGNVPDDCAC
jgi:nitrous oxidase accessory protein NosD